MQAYHLNLTDRGQFVTISTAPQAAGAESWLVTTQKQHQKVLVAVTKALKNHYLGGNNNQLGGSMYAVPLDDAIALVAEAMGYPSLSGQAALDAQTKAAHDSEVTRKLTVFFVALITFAIGAVFVVFFLAAKAFFWALAIPIIFAFFKHRGHR